MIAKVETPTAATKTGTNAPKAKSEGNFVGNGMDRLAGKFEDAAVLVNYVPEVGNEVAAVFTVGRTAAQMMGDVANFRFKKMLHSAVSGVTTTVARAAEALLPGSGDVDSAAKLATGKSLSKNIGDQVADKLVGDGKPKLNEKALEQARAAVKDQPGEGKSTMETAKASSLNLSPGILSAVLEVGKGIRENKDIKPHDHSEGQSMAAPLTTPKTAMTARQTSIAIK